MENLDSSNAKRDKIAIPPDRREQIQAFLLKIDGYVHEVDSLPNDKVPLYINEKIISEYDRVVTYLMDQDELRAEILLVGIRAAIDDAIARISRGEEVDDFGHTLGKVSRRLAHLDKIPSIIDLTGLRDVLEYCGWACEMQGSFFAAYEFYKISYPNKFKDKINGFDLSYGEYSRLDEGEQRRRLAGFESSQFENPADDDLEARKKFNLLLEKINGSEIMKLNLKREFFRISDEFKKLLGDSLAA